MSQCCNGRWWCDFCRSYHRWKEDCIVFAYFGELPAPATYTPAPEQEGR